MPKTIYDGYLNVVSRMEEERFQKNRLQFPEQIILIEDCETTYRILINGLVNLLLVPVDNSRFIDAFRACADLPNELVLASLCLLRDHIDDSHFHLRKAIELFGFASLMIVDPQAAKAWNEASNDQFKYKEFKRIFTTKNILPSSSVDAKLLFEVYDRSSRYIHSSIYSVASHQSITEVIEETMEVKRMQSGIFTLGIDQLAFKGQCVSIVLAHMVIILSIKELYKEYLNGKYEDKFTNSIDSIRYRLKSMNVELNDQYGIS